METRAQERVVMISALPYAGWPDQFLPAEPDAIRTAFDRQVMNEGRRRAYSGIVTRRKYAVCHTGGTVRRRVLRGWEAWLRAWRPEEQILTDSFLEKKAGFRACRTLPGLVTWTNR
jgi:hypothetical protein